MQNKLRKPALVFELILGIICVLLFALSTVKGMGASASTGLTWEQKNNNWWNSDLSNRIEIQIRANGHDRVHKPVEVYLDPDDYIVRPDGRVTPASEPWSDTVPWVYFGAVESDHALFMIHHEEDDKVDSYVPWPYERDSYGQYRTMTVFGFGRKGHVDLIEHVGELTETPASFTIGISDNTNFTEMSMIIESAYQDLEISIGQFEHR